MIRLAWRCSLLFSVTNQKQQYFIKKWFQTIVLLGILYTLSIADPESLIDYACDCVCFFSKYKDAFLHFLLVNELSTPLLDEHRAYLA